MATGTTRKSGQKRSSSRNGRSSSQKPEKYRFAQNVDGQGTLAEREYQQYVAEGGSDTGKEPDVMLDVPVLKVDSIHLEVDDLDAHVALKAQVLDLVTLNVGVDVHLGRVKLDVKGVEAQALVKARLDHVAAIVDRVLTTVDRNPDLVESLGQTIQDVGSGAGHVLSETGEAAEEIGEGAGQAVDEVGQGAGEAVGQVGEGAGQAVGDIGQGAGQAAGQLGEGAGQAVGGLVDQAGNVVGGAGQAVGQAGEAAGQAGQAVGGVAEGAGDAVEGADEVAQAAASGGAGSLAKVAAKTVAKEIGSAATDEAKELGIAATRKARELGERRRQKRQEKYDATDAARDAADDLGIDLGDVEGTGTDGRITVNDVRQMAEA